MAGHACRPSRGPFRTGLIAAGLTVVLGLATASRAASEGTGTEPSGARAAIQNAKDAMFADPSLALTFTREARGAAEKTGSGPGLTAEILWLEAEALMRLGETAAAHPLIVEAVETLPETASFDDLRARFQLSQGRIAAQLGLIGEAAEAFLRAHETFERLGSARLHAMALQEIGTLYANAGNHEEALEFYDRAEDRYDADPGVAVTTRNNRAEILVELGRTEAARRDYLAALGRAADLDSPFIRGQIVLNLAALELDAGNPKAASGYADEAAEAFANLEGGDLYRFLAGLRAEIALAQDEPGDALVHVGHAFEGLSPEETGLPYLPLHEIARETYRRAGMWPEAFSHLTAEKRLGDRAKALAAAADLGILSAEYRFTEQKLSIERLKNGQLVQAAALAEAERRQANQRTVIVLGAIALLFFSAAVAGAFATRRRQARTNAELTSTVEQLAEEIRTRKSTQGELVEAKEAAERANRAKSTFLATMSHELRTPLTGILGFAEVLLAGDLKKAQREQLEIIESSGRSLLTLINDILDLSQIEAGALTLREERFEIRPMVESCVQLLRAKAQERNLSLVAHVAPDVPRTIDGDEDRVRQVLINLIGNAIKFTAEGVVAVKVTSREGKICLAVRDTGPGIPTEKKDRLFRRFSQIQESHGQKSEGTGLGLSISQELSEAMGGRIGVSSEAGRGSMFFFEVPARAASAPETPAACRRPGRGPAVAVIDSIAVQRELVSAMLAAQGVEVLTFSPDNASDEELRALLGGGQALDAILVSESMGTQRTKELVAGLRRVQKNGCLPVLYFGGTAARAGQKVGACDYVLSYPILDRTISDALAFLEGEPGDRQEADVPASASPEEPRLASSGERVLVVDDVIANRKLAETVLQKIGVQTVSVTNGQEAVELASVERFGAILMDVYMPVKDGLDATRAIRKAPGPNQKTTIIGLTASQTEDEQERIMAAGFDFIIEKPVNFETLKDAVRLALGAAPSKAGRAERG